MFLKVEDYSGEAKDNNFIADILIGVIEQVGLANVVQPMLHGDSSPPKKPAYPPFPRTGDLGTLRKLTQIDGDFIGDSGTCWPSPRRSRQISGTL
jgi:hypothetical protein